MAIKKMLEANYRNSCGLCGGIGHNSRSCSQLEPMAQTALAKRASGSVLTWTEQRAVNTYEKLKNPAPKNKRRKPQCGFCGSTKHNRKTCTVMEEVKQELYKANKNWRAAFLSKVKGVGFAEGALIQYRTKALFGGAGPVSKTMGIVKSTSMKELTVLSSCEWAQTANQYWRQADYEARTKFTLYLNSRTDMLYRSHINHDIFFFEVAETAMSDALLLATHREWSNMGKIDVLQPAEVKLTDEWVEEENIHMLEWLIKNTDHDKLKRLGLEDLLGKWL